MGREGFEPSTLGLRFLARLTVRRSISPRVRLSFFVTTSQVVLAPAEDWISQAFGQLIGQTTGGVCASCAPVSARFQRFQAGSSGVTAAAPWNAKTR
jgi:hypothetical protein